MTETALSLLIRKRLDELGLTLREAAARGRITTSTLHRYAQGQTSQPDEVTVRGIAKAIAVPVAEVAGTLGLPPLAGRFVLPKRADRLTEAERRTVLAVVDALLAAHRDG